MNTSPPAAVHPLESTVCVIGAGPAGLAVARALSERGIDYTHLERHSQVGGVWDIDNPGTPMYESAHFISSRTVSGFTGFPMPDDYPDYPGHEQILAYLRSFADAYGLTARIRFGAAVATIDAVPSSTPGTPRWRVTLEDGTTTDHERVIVCTGTQWHPSTPDIPGDYTGEIRHSRDYRSPSEFTGRRVLIVGGGNSACDIACDAARTAERAAISMRRGYWFIPKHVFGVPSDIVGGKGSFLPKPLERAILQPMLTLLTGDPTRLGLQKPDHKLFEVHPVLNSQLFHYLQHGDIAARRGIRRADGLAVQFTDGTTEEFDLIVMATGYRHRVPVGQRYFGDEQHPDLYLNCVSREHAGLYGIGFIETNSGAYGLFDQQAHLLASFIAGIRDGAPAAAEFEQMRTSDTPDLSGGLHFDSSPRHRGYVDSDAYAKYMKKLARRLGWPLTGRAPHVDATRVLERTEVAA
ncbi:flavin-containing monooxygenase [Microbacterium hominis]|uniref:NAD(P)-binding domain-containing protein n=1 Tax=Microbacterium hominis TaxID=162426 RepID=A0A7D4Q0Q6_9MICO|nr:NAD(P)-binding domain-containing protein [Microbacterium hominis]QKJ19372.1 NAD(P)-binding domain-containing protein [Microbacterium hominis]